MQGATLRYLYAVIIALSFMISFGINASLNSQEYSGGNKVFPVSFDDGDEVKQSHSEQKSNVKVKGVTADNNKKSVVINSVKPSETVTEGNVKKTERFWVNAVASPVPGAMPVRRESPDSSSLGKLQSSMAAKTGSSRVQDSRVPEGAGETGFIESLRQSVRWHPLIKRAQQELALTEESVNEAQAAWYPVLDAGVKSGFEENNYTNENERTSKAVLTASQMIYDFGKTRSRVNIAKSNSSLSGASLHKNINEILYETATAWLQADRLKKMIVIARQQVEGFKAINEIAKKRRALGASAESEYSQSKVRLASVTSLLQDYSAQYNKWVSTLSSLVNRKVTTNNHSDLSVLLGKECYRIDTEHLISPAIKMADNQVAIAKEQISAMESAQYPTISLSPTYEYRIYDDRKSYSKTDKSGEFGVFINITAPIFQGGAQNSRIKQAQQSLSAAQYNLDVEKKEAERKIIEARSQIENTTYSLDAKKVREHEAVQTRNLYKLQYIELGTRSFSDLLSAESEIHQTRMDIINGDFTIASFSLDCLYLSGQLESRFTGNTDETGRGNFEH